MSWDPTMRIPPRGENPKTDEQMARIVLSRFKSGDTKDGTKYSMGGLSVRPIIRLVSRTALESIRRVDPTFVLPGQGIRYNRLPVERMGITREHVIPVEELYGYFKRLFDQGNLTETTIRTIMPKLEIAVITEEENQNLKDAGLNKRMPPGWWETQDLDPLARYRAAGLDDTIWVDWNEEARNHPGAVANAVPRERGPEHAPAAGGQFWSLNGVGRYSMGRIVKSVVEEYARRNRATLDDLQTVFPDALQGGRCGVVRGKDWFLDHPNDRRYFLDPFSLEDGTDVYVCREWTRAEKRANFLDFCDHVRKLGFQIDPVH